MSVSINKWLLCTLALLFSTIASAVAVFPNRDWQHKAPEELGLNSAGLETVANYLQGRGCVVRHGIMAYTWGEYTQAGDVASAVKPWITCFVFKAIEQGLLESLDAPVSEFEPRLKTINAPLANKDAHITFRHMANQISCYGVEEPPGAAFDYNDWQMALLFDTLFLNVYKQSIDRIDDSILHPLLTDILQCQDNPTFFAFHKEERAGRLAVSPRDFARFGLLFLNGGKWNDRQIISPEHVAMALSSPLPNSIPRTEGRPSEMIPDQRTLGSQRIPDNQTDHHGSYSWAWWKNGVDRDGKRFWPDAPADAVAALGHRNGMRGMAIIPSLDMVISWNDTRLGDMPDESSPLNEAFRLLRNAVVSDPLPNQVMVSSDDATRFARNVNDPVDGRQRALLLSGPGDPENFLYRGNREPDGTRNGDQERIFKRMKDSGANALYFQIVRSHGGDGDKTHNPFVNSDPQLGLDEDIINQWESWFQMMDKAGIAPLVFIYDDGACIWDTGDKVCDEEREFIERIVLRLEHHPSLIWCIAEEYEEAYSPARISAMAALVRASDKHIHPIAVHKLHGLSFDEFRDDPSIEIFAAQYNETDAAKLHRALVNAMRQADSKYAIILSEAADFGFGETAREKLWASAMAGVSVMALGWSFNTTDSPSDSDLRSTEALAHFFESLDTVGVRPRDDLVYGSTQYVLAKPGETYIAYGVASANGLGFKDIPRGQYKIQWMNVDDGETIRASHFVIADGDVLFKPPATWSGKIAVALCRQENGDN